MFSVLIRRVVETHFCDDPANTPEGTKSHDVAETLYEARHVEMHPRGSRNDYDTLELLTSDAELLPLHLLDGDTAYVMNAAGKTIATYRGRMAVSDMNNYPEGAPRPPYRECRVS